MSGEARTEKPPTFTERARRAQFIEVTTELIARHGYSGTSLARIAEAAGVSKAAVLYHFPTKDAVVQSAYTSVIEAVTEHVGAAVAANSGLAALEAYIRSLVEYMCAHLDHARVIIEAITADSGVADRPTSPSRRQSVAELLDAAKAAGEIRSEIDSRSVAVIVGGAIDAIVADRLADPASDPARAADELVELLRRSLRL